MKKFKKVMAMSCVAIMAISAMSVNAFAKNNDTISVETYANMNIDNVDEATRAKILEARREIIYSTD